MPTVRDVTFNLLRELGLTTIIGNPGSTEETFLQNFPEDFTYILALQECSVVGIADGLAQGLKKPVIVNMHTGAGMGNAMGCILTAYTNKTPLIITAGQQTRKMLLTEPFLTNVEATNLPKPWVKWSYEPARPEDVPSAFMRAYAMAMQQPTGPVFLSLPLDDWNYEMKNVSVLRSVSIRIAPDPHRITEFADRMNKSKNPVLVYGGDIARSNAWNEGIHFAEKLNAPVWTSPFLENAVFPENHTLYAGALPAAIGPLGKKFLDHDLVIVVGAPVFRYYPYVPGNYLPEGTKLLHITDSAYDTAKACVGDSLISDSGLALKQLTDQIKKRKNKRVINNKITEKPLPNNPKYPLTVAQVYQVLSEHLPGDYVLVQESPSNIPELSQSRLGTITKPNSYYTMTSGGLGWDMPAAVGLALAEKKSGQNRPIIAVIGDGSFQYSPQAIWTGVQHDLHIIYIVFRNEEYGILKSFAMLEKTPNVPGLDLPGLDIPSLAKGYGAHAVSAEKIEDISMQFKSALDRKKVSVIEIPINKEIHPLL